MQPVFCNQLARGSNQAREAIFQTTARGKIRPANTICK